MRKGCDSCRSRSPAVLLAFDLLRVASRDLTDALLSDADERSKRCSTRTYLQFVAQTARVEEGEDWFKLVTGPKGVVAKRRDTRYLPGQREWIKVNKQRTPDCVVIGIAGDRTHPSLVLGLRHPDGELHHFGVARSADDALTADFSEVLA